MLGVAEVVCDPSSSDELMTLSEYDEPDRFIAETPGQVFSFDAPSYLLCEEEVPLTDLTFEFYDLTPGHDVTEPLDWISVDTSAAFDFGLGVSANYFLMIINCFQNLCAVTSVTSYAHFVFPPIFLCLTMHNFFTGGANAAGQRYDQYRAHE